MQNEGNPSLFILLIYMQIAQRFSGNRTNSTEFQTQANVIKEAFLIKMIDEDDFNVNNLRT